MARNRMIKPEFWSSTQIMNLSPITRLMFVGIWNFADDFGRIPHDAKSIKAKVFPCDEIAFSEIEDRINEIAGQGLILLYAVDGKDYIEITGWQKHQKIEKPRAQYPAPFCEQRTEPEQVADVSSTSRRLIDDASPLIERKGKEEKATVTRLPAPDGWPSNFREVFWEAYPHKVGKSDALAKLEKVRRSGIAFDSIVVGLAAYLKSKPPDRPWCNPATWLHQGRWEDQPDNGQQQRRIPDV